MYWCTSFFYKLLNLGIIGAVGLVLNLLSVVGFTMLFLESYQLSKTKPSQNSGANGHPIRNMLRFLFLKSIFDTIGSCVNVASFAFLYKPKSFEYNVYYMCCADFTLYTLEMWSSHLNLGSTFDCWLSIGRLTTGRVTKFLMSINFFYIFNAFALMMALLGEMPALFAYEIRSKPTNDTRYEDGVYFYRPFTSFYYTDANKGLNLFYFVHRDVVLSVLIIIFNVLILLKMRQMSQQGKSISISSTSQQSRDQAERKRAYMIIAVSINYIIGHMPTLLYPIFSFIYTTDVPQWFICYLAVLRVFSQSSYGINFLFYYFFNSRFRAVFHTSFKYIVHRRSEAYA